MDALRRRFETNTYPGRGILMGRTADGRKSVAAYFIMGRSENSRNRVFVEEPDGIRTAPRDPSKVRDASLILYHPVRSFEDSLIVTNGNQTDTILSYLQKGRSMEEALRTREFEPDGPHWTPRISGLLRKDNSYTLSILKAADKSGWGCLRQSFEYPGEAGVAHLIHTYDGDASPLPCFKGEPLTLAIGSDIDELTEALWDALNAENRVALFVRFTDLDNRTTEQRIINKYDR